MTVGAAERAYRRLNSCGCCAYVLFQALRRPEGTYGSHLCAVCSCTCCVLLYHKSNYHPTQSSNKNKKKGQMWTKASWRNISKDYTTTEPLALARVTDSTAGQGHITPPSASRGDKSWTVVPMSFMCYKVNTHRGRLINERQSEARNKTKTRHDGCLWLRGRRLPLPVICWV